MAQEMQTGSREPNSLDKFASDACTRSGAFALLLSLVLFALIPYWMRRPTDMALGNYLANRVNLSMYVDGLDDDPVWQKYRASQSNAESMSIAELLDASVELSSSSSAAPQVQPGEKMASGRGHRPTVQQHDRNAPKPPGLVLAPPTNVTARVFGSIDRIHSIADFLINLNDSDLLTKSRGYSNYFNFSITRWLQKRNGLLYANVFSHNCTLTALELPHERQQSPNFVPALDRGVLVRCLTLRDVRELAQFELPTLPEPTQIGEHVGREIEVSPGTLPRDVDTASIVAVGLLFFVMVYFRAYAHEAVSSSLFPAQGTLFGAYCRSRWTLLIFFLALWMPLIASVCVAVASRKWTLIMATPFVFGAVFSAHLVLRRKSYFAPLSQWLLMHWRQPAKNSSSAASPLNQGGPE